MIREWKESDLASILGLLRELNESLAEDQDLSISTLRSHYAEMAAKEDVYHNVVFEREGAIEGFMSMLFYRSVFHRVGTALINELVVTKESRHRGIGSSLLAYALEIARKRGMDELEVGVMKDNHKAVRFYKANGITEEYLLLGLEF